MKPLRVLIVEDREDDMHLLLLHLRRGGYSPEYERVDTEEEMLQQLKAREWDVILADYNMPQFDGLQALRVLRDSELDLPFILVSGAIGEEIAVTAMKAGAHDYLLKDRLTRLIPAIERAIKDARERSLRRKAEEVRQQLEKELQAAKEQAELANRRKSRVLAFVAHEFKNPLRAIQTFVEILEKKPSFKDEERVMIEGIGTASEHLRSLLNDILDIAPIEAGQVQLEYEEVSLTTLLHEVEIIINEPAKQRNIQVVYDNQVGEATIKVDARRVRQILINLLSNATKYTKVGDTVILRALVTDDGKWLRFEVQDHGPGIPEEEIQNLFLDYYRVKNMLSKQNEGLGLGLALVKSLVECHEGQVSVNSVLNEGTTFTADFPRGVITQAQGLPVLL